MLRILATWIAKWKYIYAKEQAAGLNTWSARVAERNAKDARALIATLEAETDTLDARIKDVAEMEEKGFWLCENGHEAKTSNSTNWPASGVLCGDCDYKVPMKLIKRSKMTGQEKYESDKDRHDAEKLLAARRKEITDKETEADQQDATAKYFRNQAASERTLADAIRKL